MIQLFKINDYLIDTSEFSHSLHSYHVSEFETMFSKYVGAKYACGVSSATNAIFLAMLGKSQEVRIPTMIPPVVVNATLNAGNTVCFTDDTEWIGDSYVLHSFEDYKIVDSAQKVEKDQFKKECNDEDLMIFSFYPTKPIGSLDGGMIVSNDPKKIEWFKEATLNGMSYSDSNWNRKVKFPGWKMYLSSVQAKVAIENFNKLGFKNSRLKKVRDFYNKSFGYRNTSDHLYRIQVEDRSEFMSKMKERKIVTGIHYSCAHLMGAYSGCKTESKNLKKSESSSLTTVSIPFNENLRDSDLEYIVSSVNSCGKILNEQQ